MAITETARKNHEELFPGHQSTLKITDPELIEMFDNFAFDEVVSHGDLETKTRLMVILVSLGGCEPQVKGHIQANLHVGNDRARLVDVITQLLPFIGYPRALNALKVINEVTEMTE
jgi:4-carboxymuconolactone decarboxylase